MNRKQRRAAGRQPGGVPAAPTLADRQLALAMQCLQTGQLEQAEQGLRQVLAGAPRHADALTALAFVRHRRGAHDEAVTLLQSALAVRPDHADAHATLGSIHQALGRLDAAVESYRAALRIQPRFAPVLCNLGNALQGAGRIDEAVDAYRKALAIQPADATVLSNLGSALKAQGRLDDAVRCFEQALAHQPGLIEARQNLANLWLLQGRLDEAATAYRAILQLRPDLPGIHSNLGMVLRTQGRMAEALDAYRQALARHPADAAAHANLGNVLADLGRFDEARASYGRALELRPDYAEVQSSRLMLLNYDPALDDAALLAAHRAYDTSVTAPLARVRGPHANDRDPERPLRIGYVSADFWRHPGGYFIDAVLAAHDPAAVETVCYSGRATEDDLTARMRGHAGAWHQTLGVTDEALDAQIRADRIDILVDLSGHTAGNRLPLFGRKPAPVQVSWLGYFNTTGVGAIDYVLMDAATVPEGRESAFTETVVRLPEGRFCYAPPDYAPPVAPLPMAGGRPVTFGSFNNLTKVTDAVIALWARVLAAVPDARLLLKWKSLADADECRRLRDAFAAHGVAPQRLELRGNSPHAAMLAEYGDVDIGLDPFPFCGGLTSCEALWMGVPVVTLPGERPVSRQTLGFLGQLGLTEFAAADADAYVATVARLAGDPARLADLRRGLRPRMAASPLCDGPRFTRHLEAAYRAMWRRWCEAEPAPPH